MRMVSARGERRPTVLVLHPSDELYGADRVLLAVVDAILPIVDPVVVLPADSAPGTLSDELRRRGVCIHRARMPVLRRRYLSLRELPMFLGRAVIGPVEVLRIARSHRCRAVHSNTATLMFGPLVAGLLRVPHVWHIHEIVDDPRWLGRLVGVSTRRGAGRVVAVSEAVRRRLILDGGRVTDVLLNPAPACEPTPLPTDPSVLMVGRVNGAKGHETFVEAARRLRAAGSLARFRLIGGPVPGRPAPYTALLAKIRDVDPAGEWLSFGGQSSDVATEIASSRIVVLPTTGTEALNITALEAMACGRPVIASRVGGLPEAVIDGETGLLVDPGDVEALAAAIAFLLARPKLAEAMGSAGRIRASVSFSRYQYEAAWLRIYSEIIHDPAPRAAKRFR